MDKTEDGVISSVRLFMTTLVARGPFCVTVTASEDHHVVPLTMYGNYMFTYSTPTRAFYVQRLPTHMHPILCLPMSIK